MREALLQIVYFLQRIPAAHWFPSGQSAHTRLLLAVTALNVMSWRNLTLGRPLWGRPYHVSPWSLLPKRHPLSTAEADQGKKHLIPCGLRTICRQLFHLAIRTLFDHLQENCNEVSSCDHDSPQSTSASLRKEVDRKSVV